MKDETFNSSMTPMTPGDAAASSGPQAASSAKVLHGLELWNSMTLVTPMTPFFVICRVRLG